MENMYEDAFKIFVKSKNLNDIIEGLYSLIHNPIAVINNDFQLVACHSPFLFDDETWNESIRMGYVNYATFKKIRETLKPEDNYKIVTTLSSNRRLIINIKNEKGEILGLLIILEVETKLEDISDDFIKILSELSKKYIYDQNFAKTSDTIKSFFMSLLDNTFTDKTIFLQKVKDLKIDLKKSYYLLILDFNEQFREDTKAETEAFFKTLLKGNILATTYKNGDYILLINEQLNNDMIQKINDFLFKMRFYMIQSNRIIDLFSLSKVFLEEYKIFMLLQKTLGEYLLYNLVDYLPILPLLTYKKEELVNFIDPEIYQVFLYDQANKSEFIDTIYIYLVTNKSLNETAKRLYMHKNTITYRLEKIKELFLIDFHSYNKNINYIFSVLIIYFLQRKLKAYSI